ncbi:MAG: hypothetical protein IKD27_02240 [Oscillospiraceae bacterium]|nr:hypothetical protein [Oscillospiraceae bacterium]
MSEQNKIQNEEELWELLSTEPAVESKPEKKAKPAGKFEKPGAEPAAAPAESAPKAERKLDGFFYSCMAGVAAVSVAATLLITGMTGGGNSVPAVKNPAEDTTPIVATDSALIQELELENAELRAQIELQKNQITDLQAQLIEAVGSEQYLATAPTNPDGSTDESIMTEQMKAYEIFTQIKAAYNDFDREALEALIPEMDARLSYLSSDALYEYYLILEYVEQPSNG